jgi:predicted nucleotide-binding protein
MAEAVQGRLKKYHAELSAIEPTWGNWQRIEAWATGFRPILRRSFPADLSDFDSLIKEPKWASLPQAWDRDGVPAVTAVGQIEATENDQRAREAKAKLLAFLGALLALPEEQLTDVALAPVPVRLPRVSEVAPQPLPYMPFRPYRRPKVQFLGVGEFERQIQCAALDGSADEEELQANGGREAVLASIRRHLPSFDPADAQIPYGPAWVKLKPILVSAGLPVGDETTLTDIKGFLDMAPGAKRAGEDEQEWYDTMQVCLKGHQITSEAVRHPERQKKRCPKCGAATLTACPKCSMRIPGYHNIPGYLDIHKVPVPSFCDSCGEPFPWAGQIEAQQDANMAPSTNKVFVVHGHAADMKEAVARTLTTLGLDPIILHEQPSQGRTIIEKFEDYSDVGFAVVLLSPDDMAYPAGVEHKKAKPRPRARQNVVMELGFFSAKLGRNHVFTLYKTADEFELPSDFQGIVYTPYDSGQSWRLSLTQELKAAKYDVDANKLLKV